MGALARLLGHLEGLPSLVESSQMVKFAILQTGNYKPFIQQCRANTTNQASRPSHGDSLQSHAGTVRVRVRASEHSVLGRALRWQWLASVYHRTVCIAYAFHLLKYLAIDLIGYDWLGTGRATDLRWLDCLMLGRFRFVGRTNKISGEIASVFLFAFLLYRLTIHLTVPKFKYHALEFLMAGHQETLRQELRADQIGALVHPDGAERDLHRKEFFRPRLGGRGQVATSFGRVNSIFYLRSPFDPDDNRWVLRLNRTSESWRTLTLCTRALVAWSTLVVVAWIAVLYYALAGSVLTNLGFEMGYSSCVAWLRDRQTSSRPGVGASMHNDYSHLYAAPRVLAGEIRVDDIPARIPLNARNLPQANWYTLARLTMDLLENHLIYLEFILIFVAQFYMLAISSLDVALNASQIKRRMVDLLTRLEQLKWLGHHRRQTRVECYAKFLQAHGEFQGRRGSLATFVESSPKLAMGDRWSMWFEIEGLDADHGESKPAELEAKVEHLSEHLSDEIADLQATLADHFDTITRGYNLFISFFVNFLLLIWVSYTLVICTWIGSVKSRAIELEFLIAELGGTVLALILLSGAAAVRSQNVQLYPLITRAMALDSEWSVTKLRWTTILKYFHPKPFYCFTIFGSTEISLLLCLKLTSWILSAFILLANFYYANHF